MRAADPIGAHVGRVGGRSVEDGKRVAERAAGLAVEPGERLDGAGMEDRVDREAGVVVQQASRRDPSERVSRVREPRRFDALISAGSGPPPSLPVAMRGSRRSVVAASARAASMAARW